MAALFLRTRLTGKVTLQPSGRLGFPLKAVASQPVKATLPGLASGILAGGGALALGGIGCLAGAWVTEQQASDEDLAFANGTPAARIAGEPSTVPGLR